MSVDRMRCHPSIILETLFPAVLVLVFIIMASVQAWSDLYFAIMAPIPVVLTMFLYWRWSKTWISFTDEEVVVERDTLFKMKKRIPYSKIASVNVNRGLVIRLFGTSRIQININSSINAAIPEAVLSFRIDIADSIREFLASRMYGDSAFTVSADADAETVVSIDWKDVLLHSFFGQSSAQMLSGLFFLLYSVAQIYLALSITGVYGGEGLLSLFVFIGVTVIPSVVILFHYANLKVYRSGDTIYLQHGLIRTYRTSFKVTKINAVRVRTTFFSRLMHRSFIEAEVVGLSSDSNSKRPILCLMKDYAEIDRVFSELVPEFLYDREAIPQPTASKRVLGVKCVLWLVLIGAATYVSSLYAERILASIPSITGYEALLGFTPLIVGALLALATVLWSVRAYSTRTLSAGEELFTFEIGVVDRQAVTISYDKVQIANVVRGPLARRYGLGVSSVSLLSSLGGVKIQSGYFDVGELNRIHETVMDRIRTGKYDYRKASR